MASTYGKMHDRWFVVTLRESDERVKPDSPLLLRGCQLQVGDYVIPLSFANREKVVGFSSENSGVRTEAL